MSGSHYIVAFKSLEASEKVGQHVEESVYETKKPPICEVTIPD